MGWFTNGPLDKPSTNPVDYSSAKGNTVYDPNGTHPDSIFRSIGDAVRLVSGAKQAEEFSATEAQKARDENRYLSNTSMQRAVADYLAAGINPYAAATSGGASTPQSPSAHGVASGGGSLISGLFRLLAVAVGGAMANHAYKAVSSAGSVNAAIKEGKQVINAFDKGFIKPFAFDAMGKKSAYGRYVLSTLSRARTSMGYPMLDVSLESLLK